MLEIADIASGVLEVAVDYPVERIELFGSYAQGSATEKSDVDLLVEFTSLAVSLLTISSMRRKLEQKLGVPVDLIHAPLPEDSFLEVGNTVILYSSIAEDIRMVYGRAKNKA